MVNKIKRLFQTLYNYFSKNLKKAFGIHEACEIMEMKGAIFLKNVKSRWISMLSLVWCVMVEYKTLLIKMALDGPTNDKTKANF